MTSVFQLFDPTTQGADASLDPEQGVAIGHSREGRAIKAFHFGEGPRKISLIAGCHADEPVGPRLLRHMVRFMSSPEGEGLRNLATWCIIPDMNPDGAAINARWQRVDAEAYNLADFLLHRLRELPGEDIEFGFPDSPQDKGARPENQAAWDLWRREGPFDLHVTLHGMAMAAGPWYLLESSWWGRFKRQAEAMTTFVRDEGYELHDVERNGEKGFVRLGRGFTSRPDSGAMRQHFLALGEPDTAARFRPSSMEVIRSLGGDPLTLVSEMPLFITPGVGIDLGPPDLQAEAWRERMEGWSLLLEEAKRGSDSDPDRLSRVADQVVAEAADAGLVPMPVSDQLRFQWHFVAQGLEAIGVGG